MVSIRYCLFIIALLLISSATYAGNKAAHTHGLATLTLALEKSQLDIQFESPAGNLLGFEHSATSQKEKKAVEHVQKILEDASSLFSFSGAACRADKTKLDLSAVMHGKKNKHHEHGHDKENKHSKDQALSDYHKEHDHHKEHDQKKDIHSDIKAYYSFVCNDPKQINSIDVAFFKHYPLIEKINVIWITEKKQGSSELSKNKYSFSLK